METTIWYMGVSQIRDTVLGVPKLRILMFWFLHWGPTSGKTRGYTMTSAWGLGLGFRV